MKRCLLLLCFALLPGCVSAQDWAFARDDYSNRISKNDSIVVSLSTSKLPTKGTFFSQVDEAGAMLQVTVTAKIAKIVNGDSQTSEESSVFPFGFRAPVSDKSARLASLPFQGTPVKGLALTSGDRNYENLVFDVTMVRLDQPRLWTKIAQRLIGLAQGANIPSSPFGAAAKYALDFANGSLTDALQDAGKDQKLALGSRTLNFNVVRPVLTGTYLLILNDDLSGEGHVNPNDMSRVCLYRQVGAGDTIMVGRKVPHPGEMDSDGCWKNSYVALTNPYVPIILETEGIPLVDETAGYEFTDHKKSKLVHCRMANMNEEECAKLLKLGESSPVSPAINR